jgi:transcriptional regulator GlxA family with amidase domain
MKHVSIVIPQADAVLNSIVRVFKIFNWVNEYLAGNGRKPLFDLHLVGRAPRADLYGGRFLVMPDRILEDAPSSDLIIIPALAGDIGDGLKNNAAFIPWMKEQYKMGAEIVSLCTGVFLLAETGLMNGNKRTTHWFVAADCRNAFCQIKLGAERMNVKEARIHSGRGAYFSLDLLLNKFAGAEIAMACSEVFEIDFNRECQSVVVVFNKHETHNNKAMEAAQQVMDNDTAGISQEQFAEMFAFKRRNLKRGFEHSTSYAKTTEPKHEVCYGNSRAFRDIFNKMTGF